MTQSARTPAQTLAMAPPPVPLLADIALFADLDGTLAPIEASPDAVGPDPARRRLLDRLLAGLDGRLAVVSGRTMEDIDRVLEHRIAAVGAVHGLIRRTAAGEVTSARLKGDLGEALAGLRAIARRDPALLVEDKGASVALHYRREPGAGAACRELARGLGARTGLAVQEGDMVIELRPPGPDKGDAVRAFMAEPPFAGFTPIFVGDDLTDEAGFLAVRSLGGYGVIVGARRPTAAQFALPSVASARSWLLAALRTPR